jgi:hypothetical protein
VAVVHELAGRAAPAGAEAHLTTDGDRVTVTVTAAVSPLGPLPWHLEVSASATGLREPGAGDGTTP